MFGNGSCCFFSLSFSEGVAKEEGDRNVKSVYM